MKRITAVILMFALFLTSALAATAYQKSITVDYNINLEINGKTPTLTDVNGKTVQPFTYEGTTYVPIRAVANEMGALIGYDSTTNTATVQQSNYEEQYLHILNLASYVSGVAKADVNLLVGNLTASNTLSINSSNTYNTLVQNMRSECAKISGQSPYFQEAAMAVSYSALLPQNLDSLIYAYRTCRNYPSTQSINNFTSIAESTLQNCNTIDNLVLAGAENQF